jgi:uncharacterized SAM-binding protein YcdF (DUF218 family)
VSVDADSTDPTPPSPDERPRWRRRLASGVLAALALGALYYCVTLVQVWSTGNSDQSRHVDAIVVLGAAQYDGRPSPQLQARLDHVVELWNRGLAAFVVVTGGNQPGDRFTEASTSAAYLERQGISADVILQESHGHSSWESLLGVSRLLKARGLSSVLLVSDPFHSLRIRLTAQELGLTAYVSPTRTSPVRGARAFAKEMKEALGISVARVIGFRRLFSLTG